MQYTNYTQNTNNKHFTDIKTQQILKYLHTGGLFFNHILTVCGAEKEGFRPIYAPPIKNKALVHHTQTGVSGRIPQPKILPAQRSFRAE